MDFLEQIEQTAFLTWVREGGSLWGYPAILFLHTIGLATVAGVSAVINLRVLGFAPHVPLAPLTRLFAVIWWAFGVTALSGTILLFADAGTKLASPIFYVKMAFVALAVVNVQMLKTRAFRDPLAETRPAATVKVLAVTSLFLWFAATTAGRLMAYLGPVSGLD